jgi:Holliday junction resolvase
MAHSSKRKGNRFEREVVHEAEAKGLEAERAYASNGQSLGEVKACDVLVRGRDDDVLDALRIQAKRRKSHAQYLHPPDGTDAVVLREDREDALAIVSLDMLLDLLKADADS